MKKLIMTAIFISVLSIACWAQQAQTIHSSGTAVLPEACPQGSVAVLTVNLIWTDLDAAAGGTGRKIVEEAVFTEKDGTDKIKFTGMRITPSFDRGEISLDVKCEFRNGNTVTKKFVVDKDSKINPVPVKYKDAAAGGLAGLKIVMKVIE